MQALICRLRTNVVFRGNTVAEELEGGVAADFELASNVTVGSCIKRAESDIGAGGLEGGSSLLELGLEVLAVAAPGGCDTCEERKRDGESDEECDTCLSLVSINRHPTHRRTRRGRTRCS